MSSLPRSLARAHSWAGKGSFVLLVALLLSLVVVAVAAAVTVTGFTPAGAPPNTWITVTGTGFTGTVTAAIVDGAGAPVMAGGLPVEGAATFAVLDRTPVGLSFTSITVDVELTVASGDADRARALREMARVTKLGGRIAILELSEPGGGLLGAMARFHVHTLVPRIGALISGAREYRYLQQSIAAFPPASTFAQQLSECGLKVLQVTPLTFGVCHLYVAEPSSN